MNEEQLISELKEGRESAFRILVQTYQNKVYNTCLGMLQNTEDAEDVAQEVFVNVHQSIHQFKGDSKLGTWIYRIAISQCLNHIRHKKRKKRFGFMQQTMGTENPLERQKADFVHPGIILENQERAKILFKAIVKLPKNQKTAFVLHKIEGQSYTEIAVIMKLSISAIESLMFRAKQNLQKILSSYYEANEE